MATAQRDGGLYYTDKGVAVDAEGKKIEGAPKQAPDTDPSKQPGGVGGPAPGTMTMRLDDESLAALTGKAPPKSKAVSASEPGKVDEDEALPTIKDLAEHVAGLKTAEEVKAMAKRDDRVSAKEIYKARLDELKEK